ncbi:MAG: hypothetical protein AAGF88_11335 [Pseudomonadota bacterium]
MSPTSRATILTLAGVAAFAVAAYQSRHFIYDDSYITFRYAWNLVHHGELAWNLGERVEGFTNFLYTLALTPFFALGIDAVLAARGLNAAALVCLVLSTEFILRRALPGPASADARAVGRLALLGAAPLAIWTMGALETVPVAAFLMIGLERVSPILQGEPLSRRRALLAGLAFGAACLTRLDAGALVAICLWVVLLVAPRPLWERLTAVFLAGMVVTLLVGAQILWRLDYYGEILPNTFAAKVGVPRSLRFDFGFFYLGQSALQLPLAVVALAVLLVSKLRPSRGHRAFALFAAAASMLITQVLYVLWAGGDHLPAARFFIVALAPASIVLAFGFDRFRDISRRAATLVLPIPLLVVAFDLPTRFHGGAEAGLIVGRHLAATLPEGSLVAVNTAGAIPFAAPNLRFIDQLGLNDRVIAERDPVPIRLPWQLRPGHAKGDGAYVLSRAPDVIIFGGADGLLAEDALFLGGLELAESDAFHQCYMLLRENISAPDNRWLREARGTAELELISYRRIC